MFSMSSLDILIEKYVHGVQKTLLWFSDRRHIKNIYLYLGQSTLFKPVQL